jgi:hypothetical protein
MGKRIRILASVLGGILVAWQSSCKFAEITDIVHMPTRALPKSPDLQSEALSSICVDNVVYAPRVEHLDYETSRISILLFARSTLVSPVRVHDVTLSSTSGEIASARQLDIVPIEAPGEAARVVGAAVLVDRVETRALVAQDGLRVSMMIQAGSEEHRLEFPLSQITRRYMVQR